jgi:aspartyl-tRNA(Asn)/glutamyl-tRNA(Gln) amidotransferase subunit C
MKITAQQVQKVAELARLDIDEQHIDALADQLAAILAYMDKLNEVDTGDVTPTAHAIELTNAFREDAVHDHLDRENGLANAPQAEEGSFVVPKVI